MTRLTYRVLAALALLISAPHLPAAEQPGYAHPELLVSTDWVAAHRSDPDVRVVDMRDAAAYAAGHVPGAVRIEEGPLRNSEDRLTYLPRPQVLAEMLGKAGIGSRSHVIAYDDQGGKMAARLWYVLNAYGHPKTSLMNGGWTRWTTEKRAVTTEPTNPAPVKFVPRVTPAMTCASPALLARKPGVVVLDARSEAEYSGTQTSPGARAAGRIPGSVNVEWKQNVTGPDLVFKSAPELRRLYASKGITPDKQIVVY